MCASVKSNNKKLIEKYKIELERENIILNDTNRFGNFTLNDVQYMPDSSEVESCERLFLTCLGITVYIILAIFATVHSKVFGY
jgi:hypothetical protein